MAAQVKPNMKRSFIPFALVCFCIIFSFITPNTHGHDFISDALSDMDRAFNPSEPTLEDAYYLGRAVAANILAAYRPYTQNPELTRYVNRICQTLAINSSQPVAFKGYYVIILDSPEYNAFASPGGHIFLTRRLVEVTTSEDTLAAVIAHELAHIILKHGLSMISDMDLSNEMAATAERAANFSGNSPAAQRIMTFRSSVSSIIDTMLRNGYSQPQEYAADREAAAILAASGYDPRALVDMLRILQRVQRSQTGGFNTTHPTPAQRIANVEGVARQYRVQDTRSYRVPRFRNSR
jgi:predicted Zn-dependent protease